MRFLTLPMFLFSGTFFPPQPAAGRCCARWPGCSPLWHSVELCRDATTGTLGARRLAGPWPATWPCWAATSRWAAVWGTRTFTRRLAA